MRKNIDVVVIGGGYAGVMAANRLTQNDNVAVTVVNTRPVFVPRLRLHQLVGGTHDAVVGFEDVLAEDVRLVVDNVTRIDVAERHLTLGDGSSLDYDYLIYAVGSGNAGPQVAGAAEFAYPVATLESAQQLRAVLDDTPVTADVMVIGGGPAGIETAAELAEKRRSVTLVCGGVLGQYLHPSARGKARKYLSALGISVVEGPDTTVTAVNREAVELADGRSLPSRVTIWTTGFGVPDLAVRSGLRTDSAGRMITDETLTSIDDEHIVAAGDASAPSELPFRMSAYAAGCLGAHAADTVLNRISGQHPTPIDLSFPAMCVSFGRRTGIFQLARKDDTAIRLHFSGRAGKKLKEVSCEASVKHLSNEAHKPGSHHWPKDGKYRPALLRDRREHSTSPTRVGH